MTESDVKLMEEYRVNFLDYFVELYKSRKRLAINFFLYGVLGLFLSLILPVTYSSDTKFIVGGEAENLSSSLGGIASVVGISLGSTGGESVIPPALFSEVVNSKIFLSSVLEDSIFVYNRKVQVGEYLLKEHSNGLSIGKLINSTKALFKSNTEENQRAYEGDIHFISDKENRLYKILKKNIALTYDETNGLFVIVAKDRNRYAAPELTLLYRTKLQNFIIDYKTKKTKNEYEFIRSNFIEVEKEFETLKKELAVLKDRTNYSTNIAVQTLNDKQLQYDLKYNVYNQLSQEMESKKIQLNNDTPLFVSIDDVYVPYEKSSWSKVKIILLTTFIGLFFNMIFVVIKGPAQKIFTLIKNIK